VKLDGIDHQIAAPRVDQRNAVIEVEQRLVAI
jgi:hypothetical protein